MYHAIVLNCFETGTQVWGTLDTSHSTKYLWQNAVTENPQKNY